MKEKLNLLKNCINIHRLRNGGDIRELIGLEYLTSATMRISNSGNTPNIEAIKSLLLCMDKSESNYFHLEKDRKELVELLIEHEKVVDIVICSIFQWFGTAIGFYDISKLMEDIKNTKREIIKE